MAAACTKLTGAPRAHMRIFFFRGRLFTGHNSFIMNHARLKQTYNMGKCAAHESWQHPQQVLHQINKAAQEPCWREQHDSQHMLRGTKPCCAMQQRASSCTSVHACAGAKINKLRQHSGALTGHQPQMPSPKAAPSLSCSVFRPIPFTQQGLSRLRAGAMGSKPPTAPPGLQHDG